ncbi:MAG: hypothetical protein ACOVNY_12020 [Chitinophagaceae bacterium]
MLSPKNISNKPNNPLTNEELLHYVQGDLSEESKNTLEQEMVDDVFLQDAIDGLEKFTNTQNIPQYISDLNKQLEKHTLNKKKRKAKRNIKDYSVFLIAVCLILVLCILGYYLITMKS